jgi:hypothetical protein
MRLQILSLALALVTPLACDSSKPADDKKADDKKADDKKADAKGGDEKAADAKGGDEKAADAPAADAGDTLPTETETLALDKDEKSTIPLTVDVPKGCTTFNDDETTIRVDFGEGRDSGKLFGIQIAKGNEFNVNLDDLEKMMLESKYSTNKILEKTDTLLRYTMQSDGGTVNHNFSMVVDVGGDKWVCKQGNNGGYDEAASARQIEACKTIKAKG